MKKVLLKMLVLSSISSFGNYSFAQNVGIGTSTPNASAKLEISSTNSGILIPRVALNNVTNSTTPVSSPATGLMVYNTNAAVTGGSGTGFYFWDGTVWQKLNSGSQAYWSLLGNAGTVAGTNFIGTTDAIDFVTRTSNTERMRVTAAGNVGIGIAAPTQRLDVQGGNARINNTFIGDVGHGAGWGGISHSSQANTTGYALIESSDGAYTLINKQNTGTGYIGFRVGNTDRAVILNNGNMGVGTTAPAYRLDLANGTFAFGNSNVRTETRDNAGLQGNAGAQSGFFETASPTNYPAGAASWWHLIDVRHSNNGNNYAMQIAGSFFDQDFWVRKTNNNAAQAWTKLLTTANGWSTTGNAATNAGTNFIGTTDAVDFVTRTTNAERMRVTAGGNVGISSAAPAVRLAVGGNGTNVYATDAWIENNMHVQGNEAMSAGGRGRLRVGSAWGYAGLYTDGTSTGANNDLVLGASSGVVRIGPNGTGQNLLVNGETRIQNNSNVLRRATSPIIFADQFDGATPGIYIGNSEIEEGGFWANGNYAMVMSPGDNDLVKFVDEDGLDGAGSAYDGTALRARIDGAGQYFQVSDRNAKNNITKLSNGLSKVLAINGYSYDFKQFPDEIVKGQAPIHSVGIIAQEVEKVLPEAVSNTNGDYMVNYSAFVPLFIEAIKEQQSLIDEQRKLIDEMRKEIQELKENR